MAAAAGCQTCPWASQATQTVFGEGSPTAWLVFVGEQPGDIEDQQGLPFVGPSGKLFDDALAEAGIARNATYVTNAVKHFKFEKRGKRRIHQKPSVTDLKTCKPWLAAELRLVHPEIVVCLGATAAHAVYGKAMRIGASRGTIQPSPLCDKTLVTTHPSAILRAPDAQAQRLAYQAFVDDLRQALASRGTATHAQMGK